MVAPIVAAAIPSLIDIGGRVLDKLFPDPEQKAKAQIELIKLQQEGQFKELEASLQIAAQQNQVNAIEAQSDDLFKSGWRPFVGWTCGSAMAYQFVVRPFLGFAMMLAKRPDVIPPSLDVETLWPLLFGLLGLSGFRTFEKVKRVR